MILPKKSPTDSVVISFDFSSVLDIGATIATVTAVNVSVCAGADSSPEAIKDGAHQIDQTNTVVLVPVKGGLMGNHYLIEVVIMSSNGKSRTLYPQIPIGIVP